MIIRRDSWPADLAEAGASDSATRRRYLTERYAAAHALLDVLCRRRHNRRT
jgi:hypothetical protein